MGIQVYLGGACGTTTWRRDIAIPALRAAGVSWFDPQLRPGEWTTDHEPAEMAAKDQSDVLLWVIAAETRGVASVAEAAYYIAAGRRFALALVDVPADAVLDGRVVTPIERDDLNRGRVFVRTMARIHDVPVWNTVADAVRHAIELVRSARLTLADVQRILAEVRFSDHEFTVTAADGGFELQLRSREPDWHTGQPAQQCGRRWPVDAGASPSEVVQTAFKAVVTWLEHEAREGFTYRGSTVFGPHFDVDGLAALCRSHPRRGPAPADDR
jgi:hypothetical protein